MGDRRATERLKRGTAAAFGIATGLLALELAVRPFASAQQPPFPDIAHDELSGPLIESRQIEEGVGTSRFTSGGSRWTGTAPPTEAPVVVIIGDSYVVAREVADAETMGAWVERLARDSGRPVAVRQYGWRAARPQQYIHHAPAVNARWSPSDVVVVLEASDFDSRALIDTVPTPPPHTGLLDRSSLVMLMRLRWAKLQPRLDQTAGRWRIRLGDRLRGLSPGTDPGDRPQGQTPGTDPGDRPRGQAPSEIETAVMRALAAAYGDRLAIVYVANTRMEAQPAPDAHERRLAAAAGALGLRFASTREAMAEQERRGVVPRGFSTTTLGSGHLNADGHEMMGRLIWSLIQDDSASKRP